MTKMNAFFDFFINNGYNNFVVDYTISESIDFPATAKVNKVFDRRSLAYYAMGLSQEIMSPVIVCVNNDDASAADLLPGMTESYYQNVPVFFLIFNKSDSWLHDEKEVLGRNCNYFDVVLEDDWNLPTKINKKVNLALALLENGSRGPVGLGLTIPPKSTMLDFLEKIDFLYDNTIAEKIEEIRGFVENHNVVLDVDESGFYSKEDIQLLQGVAQRFNCKIHGGKVFTLPHVSDDEIYSSDLIIHLGRTLDKDKYPEYNKIRWFVTKDILSFIANPSTSVFVCDWREFLSLLIKNEQCDDDFSKDESFITDDSNICELVDCFQEHVKTKSWIYGNEVYGVDFSRVFAKNNNLDCICAMTPTGFDGAVSIFIGHCVSSVKENNYLFIDLNSFMADMNALHIQHIQGNCRICVFIAQSDCDSYHKIVNWGIAAGFDVLKLDFEAFTVEKSSKPILMPIVLR